MASTDGANPLLRQVLDSPARAAVLHGPAASGKTSAAIAFYEHFAGAEPGGGCLLLAPNAPGVFALRRRLLERSPSGVLLRPRLTTPAALAGAIVGGAERPRRALSPFAAHLLLSQVVKELSAGGKLGALESVADTPGLVTALGRSIAELKRAAVEPEDLERAVRAGGPSSRPGGRPRARNVRDKSLALVEVYRLYQQKLHEAGAYDTEGLFWEARDQLSAASMPSSPAPLPGLEGVRAIVAEGFTDFGPTQLAILEALARRMEKVLITLPLDLREARSDCRARLWGTTLRTLEGLRRTFGKDLAEIEAPRSTGNLPVSSEGILPSRVRLPCFLWDDLFMPEPPHRDPPAGLQVIAASGPEAEVAAIAWRVKRLLTAGARPGSIAVLARSMDPYRDHVERVFRRCEVPIRPCGQSLAEAPVIRYLLDAAALGPDFQHGDVLRVIKSSYFRPAALGPFSAATVATAEMLIRRGNVFAGRRTYAEAARRLSQAAKAGQEDDEATVDLGPLAATPAGLGEAAAMLEKLFSLAGPPAGKKPAAVALAELADALELEEAAAASGEPRWIARDLRALAAMRAALDGAGGDSFGKAGTSPDLSQIRQALEALRCGGERGEAVVDVLDVLDARPMRYRHIFLLGAAEGQFPQRFSENSLITERQRAAWEAAGVRLDQRRDFACREALLFYLAASRADETLTLCYCESDAAGRPAAPSAMLLSLLEPLGGLEALEKRGGFHRIPRGRFVLPAGEIATSADAVSAAVAGLFGAERTEKEPRGRDALATRGQDARDTEVIGRLAWGLYASHRRWRRGPCDAYDGRIDAPALVKALGEHYGKEAVFSASQLNTFGQCPWQFFASYVLRLAPLEEPQRRLEPVARGTMCHDVLQEVYSRLAEEFGRPVRLGAIEQAAIEKALDAAMAEQARRIDLRRPSYPILWKVLQQQVRRQLWDYLASQRQESGLATEAVCFELGFGLSEASTSRWQDPGSRTEPVPVQTPAGAIRLRGKIDRVDRIRLEAGERLLVVDYKTGALPDAGDIVEGRSVQIPLYAAAAEQLLKEPCAGGAFHGIGRKMRRTWFAAIKPGRKDGWQENDGYVDQLSAAMEKVGAFVRDIRAGRFDLIPVPEPAGTAAEGAAPPAAGDCPSYCPFRRVCQFSEPRAERRLAASVKEAAQ